MYEMKWKPDKASDHIQTELTTLLITQNAASYFQSYDLFRNDSATTKAVKDMRTRKDGQLRFPTMSDHAKFRELIVKDVQKKQFYSERKFFIKSFQIDYNCPMNWKIKEEKSNFFGYKVQKAEVDFGGRQWIAWFTNDIPISDGPYKFYGLPGLILKIEDKTKDYSFEIVGISKDEVDISERNFADGTPSKISLSQWETFWKQYKKEPSMIFANLNTAQTTFVIDGKDVNDKETKENFNKKEKELIAFFDKNPLELKPNCK